MDRIENGLITQSHLEDDVAPNAVDDNALLAVFGNKRFEHVNFLGRGKIGEESAQRSDRDRLEGFPFDNRVPRVPLLSVAAREQLCDLDNLKDYRPVLCQVLEVVTGVSFGDRANRCAVTGKCRVLELDGRWRGSGDEKRLDLPVFPARLDPGDRGLRGERAERFKPRLVMLLHRVGGFAFSKGVAHIDIDAVLIGELGFRRTGDRVERTQASLRHFSYLLLFNILNVHDRPPANSVSLPQIAKVLVGAVHNINRLVFLRLSEQMDDTDPVMPVHYRYVNRI